MKSSLILVTLFINGFQVSSASQSLFGHPIIPSFTRFDSDDGHIYVPDRNQRFPSDGAIHMLTYYNGQYAGREVRNNMVQILILSYSGSEYTVLGESEWRDMNNDRQNALNHMYFAPPLPIWKGSLLAFNFKLNNPISYFPVPYGESDDIGTSRLLRPIYDTPYGDYSYTCTHAQDKFPAPASGVNVNDRFPASFVSNGDCRVYAYILSATLVHSCTQVTLTYSIDAPGDVTYPEHVVSHSFVTNNVVCWNVTAPPLPDEADKPAVVQMGINSIGTSLRGYENLYGGYTFCEGAGIELIDGGEMQSFRNICSDSNMNSWRYWSYSYSNNLIINVRGGKWPLSNVSMSFYASPRDDVPDEFYLTYQLKERDEEKDGRSQWWIPVAVVVTFILIFVAIVIICVAYKKCYKKSTYVSPKPGQSSVRLPTSSGENTNQEVDDLPKHKSEFLPGPKPGQKPTGRLEPLTHIQPTQPKLRHDSPRPSAPPSRSRLPPLASLGSPDLAGSSANDLQPGAPAYGPHRRLQPLPELPHGDGPHPGPPTRGNKHDQLPPAGHFSAEHNLEEPPLHGPAGEEPGSNLPPPTGLPFANPFQKRPMLKVKIGKALPGPAVYEEPNRG